MIRRHAIMNTIDAFTTGQTAHSPAKIKSPRTHDAVEAHSGASTQAEMSETSECAPSGESWQISLPSGMSMLVASFPVVLPWRVQWHADQQKRVSMSVP